MVLVLSIASYLMPLPTIKPVAFKVSLGSEPVNIAWPKNDQAAVGAAGYGTLAESANQKPVPTASIAKVMLAIAVLKQKPLKINEPGPNLVFTKADEKIYSAYLVKLGSVIDVKAGQKMSEHQALEAILLPSANNIADSLAIWAFGSVNNYNLYANNLSKELKLNSTYIADASGFSPKTVSTPSDLVLLGQSALNEPIIAGIVSKKSTTISIVGLINNTNHLLSKDNIIGIKTGNTDEAGGCYLVAEKRQIDKGQSVLLIGSIMGAKDLNTALGEGQQLLSQTIQYFKARKIVSAGQKVGYFSLPWGGRIDITAQADLYAFGWSGRSISADSKLSNLPINNAPVQDVGFISYNGQKAVVKTTSASSRPSLKWRLFRWL